MVCLMLHGTHMVERWPRACTHYNIADSSSRSQCQVEHSTSTAKYQDFTVRLGVYGFLDDVHEHKRGIIQRRRSKSTTEWSPRRLTLTGVLGYLRICQPSLQTTYCLNNIFCASSDTKSHILGSTYRVKVNTRSGSDISLLQHFLTQIDT